MISNCPEKLKMTRQQHNADTKPTGVIATSLSLPDVGEIRHFLQVFAERLTQTSKHGTLLEKVASFGQIDDFPCFFAK